MSRTHGGFWKPGGGGGGGKVGASRPSSSASLLIDKEEDGVSENTTILPPWPASSISISQQRLSLPISKHRAQILYAVEHYGVVVIVGETGSGKSTQIPQYLLENGWCDGGYQVVCCQPRRIAAQTLAQRVCMELDPTGTHDNSELGQTVGYTVRFDDRTTPHVTRMKYVTDGVLVREAMMTDPLLSSYSVVIVDEAHERNLNTDALLGILKKIRNNRQQQRRKDLRIIICSATIDAPQFLNFFVDNANKNKKKEKQKETKNNNETKKSKEGIVGDQTTMTTGKKRKRRWGKVGEFTHEEKSEFFHKTSGTTEKQQDEEDNREEGTIISIDGRQYPVDVLYKDQPVSDYVSATVETALTIHELEGTDDRGVGGSSSTSSSCGDILCFLPSGEDVDRAVTMAQEMYDNTMNINQQRRGSKAKKKTYDVTFLPLYGTLPYHMQERIFRPPSSSSNPTRRIIFATNIAETSVTVPNVTHVVDSGYVKLPYFDPYTGFDRLITCPVSHASAKQRAGRAGRVTPGKCYRLYTERDFVSKMPPVTPPEILRTNLASLVLTLKSLGVRNVLGFDLLDTPAVESIGHALECLYALGAIDDDTNLTRRGMDMSAFPTEPRVSRMVLESLSHSHCTSDVVCVAGALQVRSLFVPARNISTQRQKMEYDSAMMEFVDRSGDHVTCVNLMKRHEENPLEEEDCREKFVNYLALRRAMEVRDQLLRFVRRYQQGKLPREQQQEEERHYGFDYTDKERSEAIRKCVTAGFFFNVAKLGNDGRYYTLRGKHMVAISQSSVLHTYGESSQYILFGETYDGSRGGIEVRCCSAIEGRWLRELAPHYWE